jgi:hypothetical protein
MPDAFLTLAAYGACMTSLGLCLVGLYWVIDGLLDQLRIPTIATTYSDASRPPVTIDRDQGGSGHEGAVRFTW